VDGRTHVIFVSRRFIIAKSLQPDYYLPEKGLKFGSTRTCSNYYLSDYKWTWPFGRLLLKLTLLSVYSHIQSIYPRCITFSEFLFFNVRIGDFQLQPQKVKQYIRGLCLSKILSVNDSHSSALRS
jgi:hypothetical protein